MKSLKGTQTEKNVLLSFAGESQARNRYSFFASQAKKEGYEQISAIFLDTADNEKEHAKVFFKLLEGGEVEVTGAFPAGVIGDTKAVGRLDLPGVGMDSLHGRRQADVEPLLTVPSLGKSEEPVVRETPGDEFDQIGPRIVKIFLLGIDLDLGLFVLFAKGFGRECSGQPISDDDDLHRLGSGTEHASRDAPSRLDALDALMRSPLPQSF